MNSLSMAFVKGIGLVGLLFGALLAAPIWPLIPFLIVVIRWAEKEPEVRHLDLLAIGFLLFGVILNTAWLLLVIMPVMRLL